jgi:ADP-ribose pyrophosphatase YjhB (NUDIX family)
MTDAEKNIPTFVVAVTGIVKKGNKYLLAKRCKEDKQAPGTWSMPGGKVEHAVMPYIIENSLKREIMEEVGVEIEDKVEFVYNDSFVRVSGHYVVMMTFLCFYKSGEAKALEDQDEVRWVTLKEMESMDLPDYMKTRIAALKKMQKD